MFAFSSTAKWENILLQIRQHIYYLKCLRCLKKDPSKPGKTIAKYTWFYKI